MARMGAGASEAEAIIARGTNDRGRIDHLARTRTDESCVSFRRARAGAMMAPTVSGDWAGRCRAGAADYQRARDTRFDELRCSFGPPSCRLFVSTLVQLLPVIDIY